MDDNRVRLTAASPVSAPGFWNPLKHWIPCIYGSLFRLPPFHDA